MKKLPVKLSTLMVGLVLLGASSGNVQAFYQDESGATWYTVSELLEYKEEIEAEKQNACGDDMECQQEYQYSGIGESKSRALYQLLERQFVLTAVNPDTETIRVLFFGEDMMLKSMGISEKLGIETVYIGWVEGSIDPISNMFSEFDRYYNDEKDGIHKIYAWQVGETEENLLKVDQEIELSAPGLNQNTSGYLGFGIDSGEGMFNSVGTFSYKSCLINPDYSAGAECELMISAERGQTYVPHRKTEQLLTSSNTETDNEQVVESGGFGGGENILVENKTNVQNESVKSPNTGANKVTCQKTIEFPWWMMALIVAGDAVIMWFFWPNHKKTIDKKGQVR